MPSFRVGYRPKAKIRGGKRKGSPKGNRFEVTSTRRKPTTKIGNTSTIPRHEKGTRSCVGVGKRNLQGQGWENAEK